MPSVESRIGRGVAARAGAVDETVPGDAVQFSVDPTALAGARQLSLPPGVFVALASLAVAVLCVIGLAHSHASATPGDFQDLGQAVSNATGLRGALMARWQGKSVEYQLEIKPVTPFASRGFSWVAAHPPQPLFLHIKLVDATGYALCGKDVRFPFAAPGLGAAQREPGQDILQAQLDDDGKLASLTTQGNLPCTPQQYKQVDHWDFTTNFPVLAEQDALIKQAAERKARQAEEKRKALERQAALRSGFYTEGDDRAAEYDASRNVLQTQLSRKFLVTAPGQRAEASLWAGSGVLFRYKCDQRSRCVLTRAGGTQSLSVTVLQ